MHRRKRGFWIGLAVFGVVIVVLLPRLDAGAVCQGDKQDADTVKSIMQKAMKGGLAQKFAQGKANDEEKKQLIALFANLSNLKAPKGNDKEWRERTRALFDAVKADDAKALQKAANCAGCHRAHK
jgi:hypothetical protein